MSAPGKTCMRTVRPDSIAAPWCGARGVAVRKVKPRTIIENGRPRRLPGYEETVCVRHRGEPAPT
jgi:hypothetical protein